MPLERYREKRSADRTPEPFGAATAKTGKQASGVFVIQKHDARRLHYDFRLEMEGVLRSWAVPKGPSLNPADKRLAMMVEDHPLEYGDFEGVIPEGNYGAGEVIVWDRGTYQALDGADDAAKAVRDGKLDLFLYGYKLRGAFTLVRTRRQDQKGKPDEKQQWLLIKKKDEHADDKDVTEEHPRSVLSGLRVEELRESSRIGAELEKELAKIKAPKLEIPLELKYFPINLAKTVEEPFDGDKWLFELKYDGVRALAIRDRSRVELYARSGANITGQYPEVVLALNALPFERFVIDGEIVALDDSGRPSFQRLQRRMHVGDRKEVARLSFSVPVCHFVFDLLAFDDFDLRALPLERRKEFLSRLIKGEGPLRYSDHVLGRGRDFFEAVKGANLEGMIAKLRTSQYRGKRSDDWIKVKAPLVRRFVIGGFTDPQGSRSYFGALLMGQYEADGILRFCDKVGTGFNYDRLRDLHKMMRDRARETSPFRRPGADEPMLPRNAHYCEPELVCEVKFTEWTEHGGVRHPSFLGLVEGADPKECKFEPAEADRAETATNATDGATDGDELASPGTAFLEAASVASRSGSRKFSVTHPDKVFWPDEGYSKGDLVDYYMKIATWMLPYLKDRPVMLTRHPDGINGKMFYQKDAPAFAPEWLRTEKIYSEDSKRDIAYFILENPEAIGYMANLGTITIHMWSSRLPHLERPDWVLFDVDPKGSTTEKAVKVAHEINTVLKELGLRAYLKTSGQQGLHVVVGLKPQYTYEQAKMFGELVARVVMARIPQLVSLSRNQNLRKGKIYIDYLQLGHGKTIAATFAVRPVPGAPVSTPLDWKELKPDLNPVVYNIKTVPSRMEKLKRDSFIGALEDQQSLEAALPQLEEAIRAGLVVV